MSEPTTTEWGVREPWGPVNLSDGNERRYTEATAREEVALRIDAPTLVRRQVTAWEEVDLG